MKAIELKLTLNFSEEIPNTEANIIEILHNLDDAIQRQIDCANIAPAESAAYTKDFIFKVLEK